jgi:hypothetical protein
LLAGNAVAGAGGRNGPPPANTGMSDSVRRVERQTGGQVLSAEPVQGAQGDLYRVKVLDDQGRVRVFMDDPRAHGREDRGDRGNRDDNRGGGRERAGRGRDDPPPGRDGAGGR